MNTNVKYKVEITKGKIINEKNNDNVFYRVIKSEEIEFNSLNEVKKFLKKLYNIKNLSKELKLADELPTYFIKYKYRFNKYIDFISISQIIQMYISIK